MTSFSFYDSVNQDFKPEIPFVELFSDAFNLQKLVFAAANFLFTLFDTTLIENKKGRRIVGFKNTYLISKLFWEIFSYMKF